MTPEARLKLRNLLVAQESYKQFPYSDSTGHLTIGIGRNLTDRGVSATEALTLLDDDIFYFMTKLNYYVPHFLDIDDVRQMVLVSMAFNLGMQGFLEFKEMLAALETKDFVKASDEITNSKAASQDVDRYHELSFMMKTGDLPACYIS